MCMLCTEILKDYMSFPEIAKALLELPDSNFHSSEVMEIVEERYGEEGVSEVALEYLKISES